MTAADEAAYRSILTRTSEEDRYFRFFRAVDARAGSDIHAALGDAHETVGFIAEKGAMPLGAAHAALLDDRSAELAIVVAQDARGRGVGAALLGALIADLRAQGCERFIAHSLHDNSAFSRLASSIGLRIERVQGADIRWSLDFSREPAIAS
jgi:GNAT superfamily N-acetyltransferase